MASLDGTMGYWIVNSAGRVPDQRARVCRFDPRSRALRYSEN